MIHINPELMSFGALHLRWYGIMVAIGVLSGYILLERRAKKYDFKSNDVSDISFWAMIGGIIGARMLYVIRFWSDFEDNFTDIFKVYQGGLVFLGGFAMAIAVVLFMCWLRHWQVWKVADLIAPGLALGHAFGRIGCLLNGCCFGFEYSGPCAFKYDYPESPTFPLQLVSFFANILVCLFLLWLEKRGKCKKILFLVYMLCYCVGRFAIEFGRGDYPGEQLVLGMTPAQITCIWLAPLALAVYGAIFLIQNSKKPVANKK